MVHAITPSNGIVAIIGESDISTISNPMTKLMTARELTLNDVTITGSQVSSSTFTSPRVNELLDTNGAKSVAFTAMSSAVNYLELLNAATGNSPRFQATGTDSNIRIRFRPKGASGWLDIQDDTGVYAMGAKVGIPGSATAAGKPGQWAANSTYLYVYIGDGTTHSWVRTATATW